MNIERVEAHDFRSWRELDLRVELGVTLIQGANGAGKSSILDAVWFALFGATSDAGRLIRRGTDAADVRVRIATEDGHLDVARTVQRSGRGAKVTLAVWRVDPPETLTAATTTETQALLEELLGVSRETLMASAFSAQGDGASFCEAKPTERKRILGDVLGLGLWSGLHERARAEALEAKRSADAARGALELVDGASARLRGAQVARGVAGGRMENARADEVEAEERAADLAAEAEAAREARRQHAAAVERAERARADHERATSERRAADEALARAKAAAANAPSVGHARDAAHLAELQLAEVESEQAALREASAIWNEQFTEAQREVATEKRNIEGAETAARSHLAMIEREESGECSRCGAPADAWKTSPLDTARQSLAEAKQYASDSRDSLEMWTARVEYLKANSGIAPDDAKLRIFQRSAQEAQSALARAESVQCLAGSIDAAQQRARDAMDREMQTAETLRAANDQAALNVLDPGDVEQRHADAVRHAGQTREAHRLAAAELATAEAAATAAERDAAAETAARDRVAGAEAEAVIAGILAAGFGPQGVPALILENSALPALEAEANRVLGELNAPVRIELRSQKALRSRDDVADTLDIVVLMDAMEAPYETLSGGERTRVALALRAALTRLLASKRGARVRLLVVDEPAGLDSTGCEQLAQVLEEFVTAGVFETIILVTHQSELANLIGRVVRIDKAPGGTSSLVESAAGSPNLPRGDSAALHEVIDA